jgi:ribonucleotide reductase alpha subunit
MVSASKERAIAPDKDVASPDRQPDYVLTENARRVLRARYLTKDEAGRCIETVDALFDRVADTIADVETEYGADEACRGEWKTDRKSTRLNSSHIR